MADMELYRDNGENTSWTSSSAWRIRDMALDLQMERKVNNTRGETIISLDPPPLSNDFAVTTSLARLRRDKSDVVRIAFQAAASAILEGLDKADDDQDIESIHEDDLPAELKDIPSLERLRNVSMERSHDNKEISKRKVMDDPMDGENGTADDDDLPSSTHYKSKGPSSAASSTKQTSNSTKQSKASHKAEGAPKFTRNTPASSAAALDARLTSSRAILCTAANVAFEALTPPLPGQKVDVTDVPQNPNNNNNNININNNNNETSSGTVSNMGAVVVESQTLGQRIEAVATSAARRAARRYQYRRENLRCDRSPTSVLQVRNPFAWKQDYEEEQDNSIDPLEEHVYSPHDDALTDTWTDTCLPRFLSILTTGVGHALYHDLDWNTRHGRIANILQELAIRESNFGPSLIVTVEPDVDRFAQEFRAVNSHLRLMSCVDTELLRALKYAGTPEQRRRLRKQFPDATGLPESPFHVIITSYAHFLQDYLHFCQLPFEVALIDDGASWMAAAQIDPNSPLGTVWDSAMFSKNDHQMGLAGATPKEWDFGADEFDEDTVKEAWIGLTARHRILTSSTIKVQQRNAAEPLPITGLVNFVLPHFADAVREEWDRSRISNDSASMKHFRKLLTRSTVVHAPQLEENDMYILALQGLHGKLPLANRSDEQVPDLIADDVFVEDGKIASSRRSALQWFGRPEESWLRYELGLVDFTQILEAMKGSAAHGHLCEEILTASSTTSSGVTGQVAGTLAYRLAVRCGRQFGSEQGLRQHHSALHAPPGTWLCRTCGSDCVTSQSRTHHERSCGQPTGNVGENDSTSAPTNAAGSTKGNKQHGPVGVVGKKKGSKPSHTSSEEKDPDGSIRVSGYRGVWINQAGKHFVKINGERLKDEVGDELLFANAEEAAKKHDEILKTKSPKGKVEYNFKSDGSRIVYEDVSTSSTTGLGGGAASVVPALSVINIKDLPPDVKPLLRDPRQTSRTGGNSKRHVYAYRGVCRQARKGHDRWQSQISFMGVNHYLGTFDSEWDAAAIYAWAHLILYGEEATRQAQKEGEEAAAAYEKEKRDIAAGIMPPTPVKAEKKPKRKPPKKKGESKEDNGDADDAENADEKPPKKKRTVKEDNGGDKKKTKVVLDKESLGPILTRSVGKAGVLAPRVSFVQLSDIELAEGASKRLLAARMLNYATAGFSVPAPLSSDFRPCAPAKLQPTPAGGAMLLGLSATLFGWNSQACLASRYYATGSAAKKAESALAVQYGEGGENEEFKTLIQGTVTTIGCASDRTQRMYSSLGLGVPPVGGAIGSIDCHIGGSSKSCNELVATIRYCPTPSGGFQFSALSGDDIVTMNGQRITPEMGCFPLIHEDICTVGPRVFVFLLPTDA